MNAAADEEAGRPLLLSVRQVTKSFGGVQALRDARLEVRPGEVHALLGENGAGKSTLVKILAGVEARDGGELVWNGQPLENHDIAQARALGLRIIHQHLTTIDHLTVAENLALGQERTRFGLLRKGDERAGAGKALDRLGVRLDLGAEAGSLRVAERQLIEIARALGAGPASLLVMDEPTASLGEEDVERLFRVIRSLRDEGIAIIYISHKLDEVFAISDRITVLRDGATVGTAATARTTQAEIVAMMVRRDIAQPAQYVSRARPQVRLALRDLATASGLEGISFDLHAGEVLGIYGLLGSGRTELARAIYGADPVLSGTVVLDGREVRFGSPLLARDAGLGFVPEERKQAAYPFLSVRENISTAALDLLSRFFVLDRARERREAERIVRDLRVKTPGPEQVMLRLSGGNQQKAILGRWLLRDLSVLILDDPTSGVDIGAKDEIYGIISDVTAGGTSVLVASSELNELIRICDRIMVLHQGRVAGILAREAFAQRPIIEMAVTGTAA